MSSLYERIQTNEIKMKVSMVSGDVSTQTTCCTNHSQLPLLPSTALICCAPWHSCILVVWCCYDGSLLSVLLLSQVHIMRVVVKERIWCLQEPGSDPATMAASRAAQAGQAGAGGGWMDTILNLIPGRKQKITDEPNEDAIKRTHDYLRSGTQLIMTNLRHTALACCCPICLAFEARSQSNR